MRPVFCFFIAEGITFTFATFAQFLNRYDSFVVASLHYKRMYCFYNYSDVNLSIKKRNIAKLKTLLLWIIKQLRLCWTFC